MTTQFRTHNGTWHIASTERLELNSRTSVARRNGSASEVIIRALVAHDPSRELPYLYSFDDARAADLAAARAARAAVTEYSEAEVPNAARLFELFERAANRGARAVNLADIRNPAIRFALNVSALGLRLEMGSGSNAGRIVALSDRRRSNGRRILWGTLHRRDASVGSGTYRARTTSSVMVDAFNEVRDLLVAFAADPAGYSAAHGRAHGSCCYCGRGLTDSRSLAVGYGPICADHYGLPWGDNGIPYSAAEAGRDVADVYAEREATRTEMAGIPTLEDIAREPNGLRRMAMASQRASAGLPTINRNARGEVINATVEGIETATGEALDRWARQYNVRTHGIFRGIRLSDDQLRRDILARMSEMAGRANEARPGAVVDASRVVTASYRRSGSSEPVDLMRPRRTGAEARVRRASRPALAETDETQTTITTRARRDPASRLMEDDFVWPPRQ